MNSGLRTSSGTFNKGSTVVVSPGAPCGIKEAVCPCGTMSASGGKEYWTGAMFMVSGQKCFELAFELAELTE
jgi:hypothetical protein